MFECKFFEFLKVYFVRTCVYFYNDPSLVQKLAIRLLKPCRSQADEDFSVVKQELLTEVSLISIATLPCGVNCIKGLLLSILLT